MTLNGNASTPSSGKRIINYTWTVSPGASCGGIQPKLATTTFTGVKIGPFTMLCSLSVTLTITDSANRTSSDETMITVSRRAGPFATTPLDSSSDPFGEDTLGLPPGNGTVVSFPPAGRNVSACDPRPDLNANLCPQRSPTYKAVKAYTLAGPVDDAQPGPFQGHRYVGSISLRIRLRGITNMEFTPSAPPPPGALANVYDYNRAQPPKGAGNATQYLAYVAALGQHENDGTGLPRSGHTKAVREAVAADPEANPDSFIEDFLNKSEETLTTDVEQALHHAELKLQDAARDPLAKIGTFTVYRWIPVNRGFYWPYNCTVGGTDDDAGCAPAPTQISAPTHDVRPGGNVRLQGGPFAPSEKVNVQAHSAPVNLGSTVADGRGDISASFTLPLSFDPGRHTFVLTGASSGIPASIDVIVSRKGTHTNLWWLAPGAVGVLALAILLVLAIRRRRLRA